MSSKFQRPERSYDRLAFLSPSDSGDRVKLLDHPTGVALERVLRCTLCGMDIAVGPMFEHLDPGSYVGAVCGCADTEPLESLSEAVDGAGRPGTASDEDADG